MFSLLAVCYLATPFEPSFCFVLTPLEIACLIVTGPLPFQFCHSFNYVGHLVHLLISVLCILIETSILIEISNQGMRRNRKDVIT